MSFQTYFANLIARIENNFTYLKNRIDNITGLTVDSSFNSTSTNAQSGTAIYGALTDGSISPTFGDSLYISGAHLYYDSDDDILYNNTRTDFPEISLNGNYIFTLETNAETGEKELFIRSNITDDSIWLSTEGGIFVDTSSSGGKFTYNGNEVATQTWVGNQGYLTGITSSDVTTALGYTPYNSSNPNGYTSNVGTVTSVNNVSPVNGNVTIAIPDTSNLANKDLSNLTATGEAHFQAPISDLTTIRSGASAGATAVQPSDITDVVRQEMADTINLYAWYSQELDIFVYTTIVNITTSDYGKSVFDANMFSIGVLTNYDGTSISARIYSANTIVTCTRTSSSDTTFIRQTLTDNNSNSLNITQSDGQWVISQSILVSSDIELAVNTGKTFDLSSYLPSDNYNYEVLVAAVAQSTSTSGGTVNVSVYSDLITNTDDIKICVGRTRSNSTIICGGNAIIPIETGRTIGIHQANISGTASAHKATITNFRAMAYRRIGTNS